MSDGVDLEGAAGTALGSTGKWVDWCRSAVMLLRGTRESVFLSSLLVGQGVSVCQNVESGVC